MLLAPSLSGEGLGVRRLKEFFKSIRAEKKVKIITRKKY